MIRAKLKAIVEQAVAQAIGTGELKNLSVCPVPIVIEEPRLPEHGDLSCGIALKLASYAKTSPLRIAEVLARLLEVDAENVSRFEVAPPGFINFHLATGWLKETLSEVISAGSDFGKPNVGAVQLHQRRDIPVGRAGTLLQIRSQGRRHQRGFRTCRT